MTDQEDAAAAFAATAGPGEDGVPADWTELGVGEAFTAHVVGEWVFAADSARWHHWDARRWRPMPPDAVHAVAQRWVQELGKAIAGRPGDVSGLLKEYARYRRVAPLEHVVTSARRRLHVSASDFDTHPHLLNARNGVVDLRTGELQPHDPDLLLTKLAGADYVPDARHRDIDAVVSCMAPDVRESVEMFLGAAATGFLSTEVAIFDGGGANGKTAVVKAAAAALGDYAAPMPPELITMTGGGDNPAVWLAELVGVRFSALEETKEDAGLRLERVKALTGGGTQVAARKYGQPFTYQPEFSLVVATNHRPNVNSAEYAAWRRLRLIPFPFRYVPAESVTRANDREEDPALVDRVQHPRQREAMLAWLVDGAILAFERGDGQRPVVDWCDAIRAATDAWRMSEDVIGRFVAERVELTGGSTDTVRGLDLFEAYRTWCDDERRPSGQAKNFYARWSAHDDVAARVEAYTYDGARRYRGVRIKSLTRNGT